VFASTLITMTFITLKEVSLCRPIRQLQASGLSNVIASHATFRLTIQLPGWLTPHSDDLRPPWFLFSHPTCIHKSGTWHQTTTIYNQLFKLFKASIWLNLWHLSIPIVRYLTLLLILRLRVIQSTPSCPLTPHLPLSPRSTPPSKVYRQALPKMPLQSEEQARVLLAFTTSLT